MKIELKNVYVNERMSQETTMFSATIYVDGIKVGEAENRGEGGETRTGYFEGQQKKWAEVVAYCKTLPSEKFGENNEYTIKSSIEVVIDNLLTEYLTKKDQEKFEKKKIKSMDKGVVFGVPNAGSFATFLFPKKHTAETFMKLTGWEKWVESCVAQMEKRGKGEVIFNTNLNFDFSKKKTA